MNAEQKMLKARTNLVLDHPFFGCLALRLKMVENKKIKTASTDGKTLLYNKDFIESLTNQEVTGLLAHEVMHIALGHTWRQGDREIQRWNVACDYAINYNLAEQFELPAGALIRQEDKSAEEIYASLPEPKKQKSGDKKDKSKKDKKDIDPGKCGAVTSTKGKEATAKAKAEMKAAVNQALQVARGTLPKNLKRQIQEILETVVPWHVLLRDMVEMSARNDYNWTRPNRRYLQSGIILPSLISEELPEVAIAIDTSCSITKEQLSTFAAEASAVLGVYDTTIRVIYCDARVKGEKVFTRADLPLELEMLGGGGTKFEPVFEHITEKQYTPSCLIYFTDLAGSFPEREPEYPVMWLVPNPRDGHERTVPFGDIVKF